jgi:antitoxin VapB
MLMTVIARVFKSGNSQAVRLPKEFRFSVDRVEVTQEGDALILRPHVEPREPWSMLKAALKHGLTDDFLERGREQPDISERRDFDSAFS